MRRLVGPTCVVIVALQLVSWTPTSVSLPQGAPETVCDTMLPFHGGGGVLPERNLPPYRIETTTDVLGQGQTLRLNIVGIIYGINFEGFMIQARSRSPPYQIVGQFNSVNDGSAKLMNCQNSVNNSATHTNPEKKTIATFEWNAPVDFLGEIVFNATVAQMYQSFWVAVLSKPVQIVRRAVAPNDPNRDLPTYTRPTTIPYDPSPTRPPPTPAPLDPFYNGCGRAKNCFGFPDGCVSDRSCRAVAAVSVRGDIYEFDMKSGYNSPAYVALGLSEDNKMGDDLVIECVPKNGRVNMYSSYTTARPNLGVTRIGVPQNTARILEGSYVDGIIRCRVQRDVITLVQGKMFDLINRKYHLLLATGSSLKENGVGFHDISFIPSSDPIFLAEVQELKSASTLLLRLHGAFMIAAWIGTTSLGILLARYFKNTWVGSQTCGKDQWFVWHRLCMVTTWSLTMVAFVLIFVELGAWSSERNPHAILGLVTTILCFIQPIGAFFRPAPTSSKRPYFNWLHWLGGNVAHILAIVTIFFAVKLNKAQLPEWMDWILVAYVLFHVVVHLIYSIFLCMQIAGCSADRQQTQRVNSFQMNEMSGHHHGMRNGTRTETKMDAPYAGFRKMLLGFYILVLLFFVVALILIVVLAPIEETFKSS